MVTKARYYLLWYLLCCYQSIDLLFIQQSNSNISNRLALNIKLLNALDIFQHLAFPEPFNVCYIFLDLCLTGLLVLCLRLIKKLHAVHQRQSKKVIVLKINAARQSCSMLLLSCSHMHTWLTWAHHAPPKYWPCSTYLAFYFSNFLKGVQVGL